MGLIDDIRAESVIERRCSIAELLESFDKKDADDLRQAMDDPGIPHTAITRVLVARGYDMHDKRLAAHRKGRCACTR